ncbi:hypothetical protein GQ53DRAFT_805449 [Thozetella sp. PMI_491]|nr:hypothetical protein GQ53DRAFT_805449 [Thozetella sp. PMI_491]
MARSKQQASPAWPDNSDELAKILSITTYTDTRCIGRTQRDQKKCKKPIACSNLDLLKKLLQEVAAEESVTNHTREQLEKIANLALCAQFHRNQAPGKATDWIAILETYNRGHKTQLIATSNRVEASRQEQGTCTKPQAYNPDKKPDVVYIKPESRPISPLKHSPAPRVKTEETPSAPSRAESSRLFSARLLVSAVNEKVKSRVAQPLKGEDFKPGYVYGYTLPGAKEKSEREISKGKEGSIMVKIGYSGDLNQRMSRIKYTCKYEPAVLCSTCHKEWFKMEPAEDAVWVIEMWRDWAHREPYDTQGHLKPEWRRNLELVDVKDPRCWEKFVYGQYVRRPTTVGAGGAVVSAKRQVIIKKEEQDD